MAQPIRCDYAGHDHLADVLVSFLETGQTFAWCNEAFVAEARELVALSDAAVAEADATAAAAEDALKSEPVALAGRRSRNPPRDEPETPGVGGEAEGAEEGQVIDGAYGSPPITTLPNAKDVTPAEQLPAGAPAEVEP